MSNANEEAAKGFAAMKGRVVKLDDNGADLLFHEGRTCYD